MAKIDGQSAWIPSEFFLPSCSEFTLCGGIHMQIFDAEFSFLNVLASTLVTVKYVYKSLWAVVGEMAEGG